MKRDETPRQADDIAALAMALRDYRLPQGVLPLAPSRTPFAEFHVETLISAASQVMKCPEKRGIISHAVRDISQLCPPSPSRDVVTMEAHLDARAIPRDFAEFLLAMGFELDGFAEFKPEGFRQHYTLKYKVDHHARARRAELWAHVNSACQEVLRRLALDDSIEAYLELEIYPSANRRTWQNWTGAANKPVAFPLNPGDLDSFVPARSLREAAERNIPLSVRKAADLHIKIPKSPWDRVTAQEQLIQRLCECGFYRVVTWAGNDICTAQFSRATDAKRIFILLSTYFDHFGGASEMTLEMAPHLWRTATDTNGELTFSELPPLVRSIKSQAQRVC